jgi:hypothetical protein
MSVPAKGPPFSRDQSIRILQALLIYGGHEVVPISEAEITIRSFCFARCDMLTDKEKYYFSKAIDSFKRRLIVISPEFEILASNSSPEGGRIRDVIGKLCHEVFYERPTPCENCAVKESALTRTSALRAKEDDSKDLNKMACLYSYPIFSEGRIEAFVSMDFDLPTRAVLKNSCSARM